MLYVPFPAWFLLAKNTLDLVHMSEDENVKFSLSIFAFCRPALTKKMMKRTILGHGMYGTLVVPRQPASPRVGCSYTVLDQLLKSLISLALIILSPEPSP